MTTLPRLLHRRRRGLLAGLVLCGLGQAALAGGIAVLMRFTFDAVLGPDPQIEPTALTLVAAGLSLAGVGLLALRVTERGLAERLGQDYVASLRARLFRHALATPIRELRAKRRGALMLRFVGDLTAIKGWISAGIARIVVATIALPMTLAVLAWINAPMALAAAAVLLGAALGVSSLRGRLAARHRDTRRRRVRVAAELGEKIGEAAVVRTAGRGEYELSRLRRLSRRLVGASVRRARLSALIRGTPEAAAALALGLVVVVGVHQVAAGVATPGAVVAVITALGLLTTPVRELAGVLDRHRAFLIAREKVENFLATPTLRPATLADTSFLPRGPLAVGFEDVSLPGSLDEVSLDAPAGSLVAIVGPNGAGKSSLLLLAAGLIAPAAGRVTLGGFPVHEIPSQAWARAVGIVSPELPLLRGTIRDAVTYRAPDADDAELARVAALVGLEPILARFADGWDEPLVEGGRNLSAGIRQRVALARAILKRPGLLLLDEADAEFDLEGRTMLDRLLARREQTTLMVSHDPARVRNADRAWHLASGRAVLAGPAHSATPFGPETREMTSPARKLNRNVA